MKERPIIFSTQMVQAILEGRKTMTRRIIKFPKGWAQEDDAWDWVALKDFHPNWDCPYSIGDTLWVRESFTSFTSGPEYKADGKQYPEHIVWSPSIHMPRSAARLFLKITDIRVERLIEISMNDVIREGTKHVIDKITGFCGFDYKCGGYNLMTSPQRSFKGLWESNPWVWVISFEKLAHHE